MDRTAGTWRPNARANLKKTKARDRLMASHGSLITLHFPLGGTESSEVA